MSIKRPPKLLMTCDICGHEKLGEYQSSFTEWTHIEFPVGETGQRRKPRLHNRHLCGECTVGLREWMSDQCDALLEASGPASTLNPKG